MYKALALTGGKEAQGTAEFVQMFDQFLMCHLILLAKGSGNPFKILIDHLQTSDSRLLALYLYIRVHAHVHLLL